MDPILERLLANNLSDLSGLTVDATVPFKEFLLNELIMTVLRDNPDIKECQITVHRENRVSVDVHTPRWPWHFKMKLRLFGSVDFGRSPTLRAFMENNLLLGKLGSWFNVLPEGISLYEDQLSIDLGSFVTSPEQHELLKLVKAVNIRTEEGKLILDVRLEKQA